MLKHASAITKTVILWLWIIHKKIEWIIRSTFTFAEASWFVEDRVGVTRHFMFRIVCVDAGRSKEKEGERKLSINQWGRHKKNLSKMKVKKAAAVQSAALLCSVRLQFSAVMASNMLNAVNHTLIISALEWSISVWSCLSKIAAFLTDSQRSEACLRLWLLRSGWLNVSGSVASCFLQTLQFKELLRWNIHWIN